MHTWYVRSEGSDPVGPLATDLVVRGILAGRVPPDAAVMAPEDGAWRPLAAVPAFAAALRGEAPPPAQATPTGHAGSPQSLRTLALVGVALALTLLACGLLSQSRPSRVVATPTATTPAPTVSVAPEPPREPTLAERLKATGRLPDALELILPGIRDTQDKPDPASSILALWMADNPSWSAIQRLPETTHARILKDSESERGKRLCVSGQVVQIAKEQGTKLFFGTLFDDSGRMTYYYAAGSTGDIVDGHRARFCGVSAGRFSYENTGGGTTHAVRLVGMFDLPENRKL